MMQQGQQHLEQQRPMFGWQLVQQYHLEQPVQFRMQHQYFPRQQLKEVMVGYLSQVQEEGGPGELGQLQLGEEE